MNFSRFWNKYFEPFAIEYGMMRRAIEGLTHETRVEFVNHNKWQYITPTQTRKECILVEYANETGFYLRCGYAPEIDTLFVYNPQ